MGSIETIFLVIAVFAIVFLIIFKNKKSNETKKHYYIRQLILFLVAILSFILMLVFITADSSNNSSGLEQVSSTSKQNIVDKSGKISYTVRTGKNAKVSAYGDSSSAKIKKLSGNKYKITFHLDSDNYDYIEIKSYVKGYGTDKIKKTIYNHQGVIESRSESQSISSSVAKNFKNVSDNDDSEYTDDMAGEIKKSVNDNESISANKVSVDGQFDAKPKTMAISIRSDDFTGKHDEDYLSILDAIKVSQKHNISDFSNVKYVLVGKLTDGYKDSYEPIAWFNFSGKSLKGLKTNEVTLDMLEGIANDYHFKPLK